MSRQKRVRHGCMFRLETGSRRGKLCGALISVFCRKHRYCAKHSMLLDSREAMKYFAEVAAAEEGAQP